jgi:replicative DNA helicase
MTRPHPMASRAPRDDRSTPELPPASPEAEKAALGCILLDPEEGLSACQDRGVTASWFYDTGHATLYQAMTDIYEQGRVPDIVTLCDHLEQDGRLEQFGGAAGISALTERATSVALLPTYLDLMEPKHNLRMLLRLASGLAQSCRDPNATMEAVLGQTTNQLLDLSEKQGRARTQRALDFAEQLQAIADEYSRPAKPMRGMYATGMSYVDKILDGIGGRNGNFVVFSGRPGAGKTAMAIQLAMHVARQHVTSQGKEGAPVGIFSMEMAAIALFERMLFAQAKVNLQKFRTGYRKDSDGETLCKSIESLMNLPIWVDDTARMDVMTFKARARRMVRQHGIRLLVVDYIQLMRGAHRGPQIDRVQELEEISGEIQALAKELAFPIIVLAQMNRDYEKDPLRAPRLSDLKNCGAIEQDADVVGFLYKARTDRGEGQFRQFCMRKVFERARDLHHLDEESWLEPLAINLLVAKARYGPADKNAALIFHRADLRFDDFFDFMSDQNEDLEALQREFKEERARKEREEAGGNTTQEAIDEIMDRAMNRKARK